MSVLQAILLGLVQGMTEFFPISSSGHLILLPRLFGWEGHSLAFDAVLHLGTGLAALCYFRKEWLEMICGFTFDILNIKVLGTLLTNRHSESRPVGTKNLIGRSSKKRDSSVSRPVGIPQNDKKCLKFSAGSRRLVLIVLASVPAGIAGLLLNNFVEANLRSPRLVAAALFAVAVLMLVAERFSFGSESVGSEKILKQVQDDDLQVRGDGLKEVNSADALVVGISQVLALIPGVSRSGITMTAGLFCGLNRESAARFSFLLATPIVLGAGIWGMFEVGQSTINNQQLAIGFVSSLLSGLLAIKFFLKLLNRWGLVPFAVYRILLALSIFALF